MATASQKKTKAAAAADEKADKPKPKSLQAGDISLPLPTEPPPLFRLELGELERAGASTIALASLILEAFLGDEGYAKLKDQMALGKVDGQPEELAGEITAQYGVDLGESTASSTS